MIDYNDMWDNGKYGLVNGIRYAWGLYSCDGAWFELYPRKDHTKKDIADAKKIIRYNRDAVVIQVLRNVKFYSNDTTNT